MINSIRIQSGRALLATLPCIATIACGASKDGGGGEATSQTTGTLLASVTMADGHTVKFVEVRPGEVLVAETQQMGVQSVLRGQTEGKSLSDIYHLVRPDVPAPAALVEADARIAQARVGNVPSVARTPPPAPAEQPGSAQAPKFYTPGEQAWFQATYCQGRGSALRECRNSSSPLLGTWVSSYRLEVDGMTESEASDAAEFWLSEWQCNSGCVEQPIYSESLPPGWYGVWVRYGGLMYRRGGILSSGSGPFDLATYAPFPTCGPSGC